MFEDDDGADDADDTLLTGHFPIKSTVDGLTEVHQRYILGRAQGVLDRCTQKREKNSGKWGGAPNPNPWKILLGAYFVFFPVFCPTASCLKNVELLLDRR